MLSLSSDPDQVPNQDKTRHIILLYKFSSHMDFRKLPRLHSSRSSELSRKKIQNLQSQYKSPAQKKATPGFVTGDSSKPEPRAVRVFRFHVQSIWAGDFFCSFMIVHNCAKGPFAQFCIFVHNCLKPCAPILGQVKYPHLSEI